MTPSIEPRFRGGSGPPLVLIHAAMTDWRLWSTTLPFLTPSRDVLAPTILGHHGGPPLPAGTAGIEAAVDALEAELDVAGFDSPDVVGNSLGGWAALELARRGRARSVVAIAPAGMHTDEQGAWLVERLTDAYELARAAEGFDELLRDPDVRRAAIRLLTPVGDRVPFELACDIVDAVRHTGFHVALGSARRADGSYPSMERPEEVTVPVLLLWGPEDELISKDQIERYAAGLGDARLKILGGAGHSPQIDRPELIAREILGFVDGRG